VSVASGNTRGVDTSLKGNNDSDSGGGVEQESPTAAVRRDHEVSPKDQALVVSGERQELPGTGDRGPVFRLASTRKLDKDTRLILLRGYVRARSKCGHKDGEGRLQRVEIRIMVDTGAQADFIVQVGVATATATAAAAAAAAAAGVVLAKRVLQTAVLLCMLSLWAGKMTWRGTPSERTHIFERAWASTGATVAFQ